MSRQDPSLPHSTPASTALVKPTGYLAESTFRAERLSLFTSSILILELRLRGKLATRGGRTDARCIYPRMLTRSASTKCLPRRGPFRTSHHCAALLAVKQMHEQYQKVNWHDQLTAEVSWSRRGDYQDGTGTIEGGSRSSWSWHDLRAWASHAPPCQAQRDPIRFDSALSCSNASPP